MRARGLAAACGLVLATGVARAEPRPIEVGGYLGVAVLPRSNELGNSWAPDQVPGSGPALGARAAWWLWPRLVAHGDLVLGVGVEAGAQLAMASTSSDAAAGRGSYAAPVLGLGAHLIAALGTGTPVTPHVFVGGGANAVFTSSPFARDDSDPVAYWGVGASWWLRARLAVRVDVRQGVEAGRMNDTISTFEADVGVTALIGGVGAGAGASRPTIVDDTGERVGVAPPPHDAVTPPPGHDVVGPPPPPPDRDADGVVDADDQCPDMAEDRDGFADGDGCPDPDNDGDGILDTVDQCPDQAETVNGYQDADGCPDQLPAELAALRGPARGVTFAAGKARLDGKAKRALDAVAATLRKQGDVRVRIEGHAGKGVSADLAGRRAEAVKWYLVDAGIAADRLDTAAVPADGGAARIELELAGAAPSATAPAPAAPATAPAPAAPAPAPHR